MDVAWTLEVAGGVNPLALADDEGLSKGDSGIDMGLDVDDTGTGLSDLWDGLLWLCASPEIARSPCGHCSRTRRDSRWFSSCSRLASLHVVVMISLLVIENHVHAV